MNKIVTNSYFQQWVGKISQEIGNFHYTVLNRGKPKMVVLPYFEGNEGWLEDYLEAYEIQLNKSALTEELQNSLSSGKSSLVI